MSDYLKGNYKSPKLKAPKRHKTTKKATRGASSEEFEKKALERLGGSIAFVMKSKTFLWDGPQGAKTKN